MPLILCLAIHVLWGLAISWVVRSAPGLHKTWHPWPLLWMLAFEAAYLTPCLTAMVRFYPCWSLSYVVGPATTANCMSWDLFVGILSAATVVTGTMGAVSGFFCGRKGCQDGKISWFAIPAGFVAAIGVGFGVWSHPTLGRVTGCGEWADSAVPILWSCPCGWLCAAAVVGAALFTAVVGRRYANRTPSSA